MYIICLLVIILILIYLLILLFLNYIKCNYDKFTMYEVIFKNDNNVLIKLIKHKFSEVFKTRDNHEVYFRKIHSYLIKNKIINGNIIDLGAWIGDNSIPWAKQLNTIIYAIDPSKENINYINSMAIYNNIKNIKTINKAISDKNEIISTSDDINHCSFNDKGLGKIKINAVTLDYLLQQNEINNISLIHLDVEGFELKVILGSLNLIKIFSPIISFEQHILTDNYLELSNLLYEMNYNIYLINEVLPGCKTDCRNLIAFPKNLKYIDKINEYLDKKLLVSIKNHNIINYDSLYTATIYGTFFNNKEHHNIKSVKINKNLYVFSVNYKNYTIFVAIDSDKKWIHSKYILSEINLNCKNSIINAYNNVNGIIKEQTQCNIKNIKFI